MSGPSSNYDPVEVTPLSPEEVTRMRDEAIAAINAARNLDELKAARLAHAGDRAPPPPANRGDRGAAAAGPGGGGQAGRPGPRRGQAGPDRPHRRARSRAGPAGPADRDRRRDPALGTAGTWGAPTRHLRS